MVVIGICCVLCVMLAVMICGWDVVGCVLLVVVLCFVLFLLVALGVDAARGDVL